MMKREFFRQWRPYLKQFYRKHPRTTTNCKYRLLDYHWANFGWGKHTDGTPAYHPNEVWLYKCNENPEQEWHTQAPTKIVFPHNCKRDGTFPRERLVLLQWIASKGHEVRP